jgi:integral membrane sensor domain MASE1/anti-anti-sigma regulatory factor
VEKASLMTDRTETPERQGEPPALSAQIVYMLAVAAGYYLLVELGFRLVVQPQNIAAMWPPSGFALAVLLRTDRRGSRWLLSGIFAANFIGNLSGQQPAALSLAFACVNILEASLGAWILRRYCGPRINFRRTKDATVLVVAALLACSLSATIGAAGLALHKGPAAFWGGFSSWLISDTMSVLLITPLILTWWPADKHARPRLASASRPGEAVALLLLLLTACYFIFVRPMLGGEGRAVSIYLLFPFILWATMRFGPPETTAASLLVAVCAIVGTSSEHGANFFGGQSTATVYWLQLYLSVLVLSGLFMTVTWSERTDLEVRIQQRTEELVEVNQALVVQIDQRERADLALQRANDELEARVRERTAELLKTNEVLAAQIDERRRAEEIISQQARELLELSTPIVKIRDQMELVPLIGTLAGVRAEQLLMRLLERVHAERSAVVLFDITGVTEMDQETVERLQQTIAGLRLLGAQAILTGVRPAIARMMVELGVNLAGVVTCASVADGLEHAQRVGLRRAGEAGTGGPVVAPKVIGPGLSGGSWRAPR